MLTDMFLYLHAQTFISHAQTFIYPNWNLKKTKLNELTELEYWETPSQMSSYAYWHASLYLQAKTSIKTSIYFSD